MYKKCQAGVQKMYTCLSICDSSRTYSDMARYLLKKIGDGIGRMPTKKNLSSPTETQGEQHVQEYDKKQDRKIFREGSWMESVHGAVAFHPVMPSVVHRRRSDTFRLHHAYHIATNIAANEKEHNGRRQQSLDESETDKNQF